MELLCGTLCAALLFGFGALTAMLAAGRCTLPYKKEKRTDSQTAPEPSEFEQDLHALLQYMPGEEQEGQR